MATKPDTAHFDGRSWSTAPLRYSRTERAIVWISTHLMPLFTRLLISDRINTAVWRLLGCRVAGRSRIRTGTQINVPFKVTIGRNCLLHGNFKTRGGLQIGDGVEMVEDVLVSTQSHDTDSHEFQSVYEPVKIEDFCWIGPRAVVLQGVTLGTGTVVGANAVVTRSTQPWQVYAGIPARAIKKRAPLRLE
jgi:maltose O-acetyltransferase